MEGISCLALLDTGSQVTTLSDSFYSQHLTHIPLTDCCQLLHIEGAGGDSIPYAGYFCGSVKIDGAPAIDVPILVVKTTNYHNKVPCLVGTNVLRRLKLPVDSTPHASVSLAVRAVQLTEEHLKRSQGVYGTVYSAEQHVLQPGQIRTVCGNVRVTVPIADDVAYLSAEGISKFDVIQGLVDVNSSIKNVSMELSNPTSEVITVEKGAQLGNLHQATLVQDMTTEVDPRFTINIEHLKEDVSPEQFVSISDMFTRWSHVFSKNSLDIGSTTVVKHRIDLLDDTPVKEKPRRIPPHLLDELRDHLRKLLAAGIIEESKSPWSSPVVLVRKKSGELRLCVDYRKINLQTKKDSYAIPTIEQLLDMLGGASWFVTLDLTSGFHQIGMEEAHKERTAFTAGPLGFYQYCMMPMGLGNSVATCQRGMEYALDGYNLRTCLVYLDDVIVFGKSVEELQERLEQVLERVSASGLKLRPNKCEFFHRRIKYLGHLVTSEGVECDPGMLEAVANWKEPQNVKQLQQFLGFANFYRRFIKSFANIALPLTKLLGCSKPKSKNKTVSRKEPMQWSWGAEQQEAFEGLKEALVSPPVLRFPDWTRPFVLRTDASLQGLGAVLCQDFGDKAGPNVIAYASRTLKPSEKNYSAYKLEFLAMYWAIAQKFNHYLHGRQFTVTSDHNPLTYVMSSAKLDAAGHRWLSELSSSYKFNIRYKPGKANVDADILSRMDTEEMTAEEVQSAAQGHLRNEYSGFICQPIVSCKLVDVNPEEETIDWAYEQDQDPVVKSVKELVTSDSNLHDYTYEVAKFMRDKKKLVVKDDILYRLGEHERIIVPKHLKGKVLNRAHDAMGHQGREKTLSIFNERLFWPGITKDTDLYIKRCERCVRAKPLISHKAPLHPILSSEPLEIISTDYLKLENAKGGYSNILVITDTFTKFAQAVATTSQSAPTTARHLQKDFIYKYGIPKKLLSDQGGSFEGKVIQEMCKSHGIIKNRTTPYHPEGDGATERMNRSLLNMLRTLENYEKIDWKQHLSRLVYAYNCTKHTSTGYSPYYLMFGRHPRLPIDALLPQRDVENVTSDEYADDMRKKLKDVFETAAGNHAEAKAKQKKLYDKKVYGCSLDVGDLVLVKRHRFDGKHKIADRWEDTVQRVMERVKPGLPIYRVKPENGKGKERVLHRNNLLPITWPLTNVGIDVEQKKGNSRHLDGRVKDSNREKTPCTVNPEDDDSDEDVCVVLRMPSVNQPVDDASSEEKDSDEVIDIPTSGCGDVEVYIADSLVEDVDLPGGGVDSDVSDAEQTEQANEVSISDEDEDKGNVPRRYPQRNRRPIERYGGVVTHQIYETLPEWKEKTEYLLGLCDNFKEYHGKILDCICKIMVG